MRRQIGGHSRRCEPPGQRDAFVRCDFSVKHLARKLHDGFRHAIFDASEPARGAGSARPVSGANSEGSGSRRRIHLGGDRFRPSAGRARLAEPKPMGCYVLRPPLFEWHDYRRLSQGGSPYRKVVAHGFRFGKPRPTSVGSHLSPDYVAAAVHPVHRG